MTYYVRIGGGTGAGTSKQTAWSPAFYNSTKAATLVPGDVVLLREGDVFPPLLFPVNGAIGNNIIYGNYNDGANTALPRISGATKLVFDTNETGGVWSAPLAGPSAIACVTLDDNLAEMGRFPRNSWATFESHSGNLSITDTSLTGSPSWVGAEVAIRMSRYIINRFTVTSHSGNTLVYNTVNGGMGNTGGVPTDGNGYLFQSHINTIRTATNPAVQVGDWYYNAVTDRFYMYFGGGNPDARVVKATISPITANLTNRSYLTFNNIVFEGGQQYSMYCEFGNRLTFVNCSFSNSGGFAGQFKDCTYLHFTGCKLAEKAVANGMYITDCNYSTLTNNSINNVGMFPGMGNNSDGNSIGLSITGNNNTVTYLRVENTGYNGVEFEGSNFLLDYFYINGFCYVRDDGGGVYSYKNQDTNRIIRNGIILNGQSALEGGRGDTSALYGKAAGVYMDDEMANVTLTNLFVANCSGEGVFIHGAHDINIVNCTLYNNRIQLMMEEWMPGLIYNINRTQNKYISKATDQPCVYYHCYGTTNFATYGTSNFNIYSRPLNNTTLIKVHFDQVSPLEEITLSTWRQQSSQDVNSTQSSVVADSVSQFKMDVNPSTDSAVTPLAGIYKDVTGQTYSTSYSLPKYEGRVLIFISLPNDPVDLGLANFVVHEGNAVAHEGMLVFSTNKPEPASNTAFTYKFPFPLSGGNPIPVDNGVFPYTIPFNLE